MTGLPLALTAYIVLALTKGDGMKDGKDKMTGNLLRSAGARRQAELKERREKEGFKKKTLWVNAKDYEKGINDAQLGSKTIMDFPEECDAFSWMLGYSEWIAKFEKIRREKMRDGRPD